MSEESLIDLVNKLKEKCVDIDCEACDQLGLSPAEYDFFNSSAGLSHLDISKIGARLQLSQSRLSRVIDKLVNNGFLDRKADPKDRRAIKISFTSKGRNMRKKVEEYKSSCELKLQESLSEAEISIIQNNLLKLINHL